MSVLGLGERSSGEKKSESRKMKILCSVSCAQDQNARWAKTQSVNRYYRYKIQRITHLIKLCTADLCYIALMAPCCSQVGC